jgi:hypothetical protein
MQGKRWRSRVRPDELGEGGDRGHDGRGTATCRMRAVSSALLYP